MLQGKQVDRMTAKVRRLNEVYAPFLIEDEIIPEISITEKGVTKKISAGDKWGGEFCYATFSFTVPKLSNDKYYVCADTGAVEHLIMVNGKKVGMLDYIENAMDSLSRIHRYTLLEDLKEGDKVSLEGYYSHTIPGTMPYNEKSTFSYDGYYPDRRFCKIALVRFYSELKEFIEKLELFNGYYNICGDWERVRAEKVYEKLFSILSMEKKRPEKSAVIKAVKLLDEFYTGLSSPKTPYVGVIGHSHLDTAWLWTVEETRHKYLRTLSNAVTLLKRYPEYRFFFSTVLYLDWLKEDDPELFKEVKTLIAQGRIEPNGSAWVECDCNLTGAESLCRQFVRGIRWLRENTGYVPDTFWLPDTFGYSAALPQIMKGVGIKNFLTTKLSWNDTNKFPYENFRWKGIDGSEVKVHFNSIHSWVDFETVSARLSAANKRESDSVLIAYGFGDGGGGPSDEMVRRAIETQKHCPFANVKHTTVSEFMERLDKNSLPLYFGELYLELHRGTFTTNHKLKKYNRLLENGLHNAELISVFAGDRNLKQRTDRLYDTLMLNQFHDILPGTCIAEATDIAIAEQYTAIEKANELISGGNGEKKYFNTLQFSRCELLKSDKGQSYTDFNGCERKLAPYVFDGYGYGKPDFEKCGKFTFDGRVMLSPDIRLVIDDGAISSLIYKGREYVSGGINIIEYAENVPYIYDNWDIDADYKLKIKRARCTECSLVSEGKYFAVIRLKYEIGEKSTLVTDIRLRADSQLIEFENKLSVYDKQIVIRSVFGLTLFAPRYVCETQFGYIERNCYPHETADTAKFEVCAHKWTDLSERGCGMSLFSDCKYGVSCEGGKLALTLHKGGTHPDDRADCGEHIFRYALYPHENSFGADTVKGGYAFSIPPVETSIQNLSVPFEFEGDNSVIIETVKHGEEEGIVLRIYESLGATAKATIKPPKGKRVYVCNILEDIIAPSEENLIFTPFEIKTMLIK